MRTIQFILFFTVTSYSFSQDNLIVLSGTIPNNSVLEFKVITDYITPSNKLIDVFNPDDKGQFYYQFEAESEKQYILQIEGKSNQIFMSPGYKYQIQIGPDYLIKSIDSEDPSNDQIQYINLKFLEFIKLSKSKNNNDKILDSLKSFPNNNFKASNKFVYEYQQYALAFLLFRYYRSIADNKSLSKIEQAYYIDAPVLYHNPKYFILLGQYYWVTFNAPDLRKVTFFKNTAPFERYLDELRLINNDTVQQIAILNACKSAFKSSWGGNTPRIIQVIDSIKRKAVNQHIVNISNNLLVKYGNQLIGQVPPDFKLLQLNGIETSISKFKGQYVLLDFWYIGCRPCTEAMPVKKSILDSLSSYLTILSINTQDKLLKVKDWATEHNEYYWPFLSAYKDPSITEFFQINSFPTYILINKEGEIISELKEIKLGLLRDKISLY